MISRTAMVEGSRHTDSKPYEVDLLLVLPVCLARDSDGLLFESQACNGMERWLENFSRIEVICPVLNEDEKRNSHSTVWKPISEIANADRVKFIPLPYATSAVSFAHAYLPGRSAIRRAINESQYLCFAIGGLFGDWGAVACLEARRLGRPYAVWTDRVEHKVGLMSSTATNPIQRFKERLRSRLMFWLERRCIRRASLGLFHGASCYSEYATWCSKSFLVQDFPIDESDLITKHQLDEKCRNVSEPGPLTISYAGRADEMKGPFDWLDIMDLLHKRGVSFKATWLGDGPLLAEMRCNVTRRGLGEVVSLPGFVASRAEVLAFLRNAHLFVFCHKTPESPRCLVEALISGCPIAGYDSEYVAELVRDGGGIVVAIGEKEKLVDRLVALDSDRRQLVELTCAAVPAGKRINNVAGFQFRSNLIKAHL